MLRRGRARRLLALWFVSTLVLTLAPFGPLRAAPLGLHWILPAATRLGTFDFLANVALFIPLGVFGIPAGLRKRMAIALGMLFSLLIECAQAYLVVRYPSWFDLVANWSGAALGALLGGPMLALARRLDGRAVRAAILLAGGATALWLARHVPEIRRFGLLFPFALSVLATLVGTGLWRPRVAFVLSVVTTAGVCVPLWQLDAGVALVAGLGAAAGVYPVISYQSSALRIEASRAS